MSLDWLDADKDGRLPPTIRNLVVLIVFFLGCISGWFAHANWSLRGEADQLVEDAREVREIKDEADERHETLRGNIQNANKIQDDCLDSSNEHFVDELRRSRGEKGSDFD